MTVIAHLSDLHIPGQGRLFGKVDTERRLARFLETLAGSDWDVSALLVTGDIADRGEPASYRRALSLLQPAAERLAAELICLPGNHDDVDTLRRELSSWGCVQGPDDLVAWLGGLRIIGLDSTAAGGHHGELTTDQLARLSAELTTPAPCGTVLALHHPPVRSPLPALDELQLRDPESLAEAIRDTDVRIILCGHDHHTSSALLGGVPVWVAPSLAYSIDMFAPHDRIKGTASGAAALLEITPDSVMTTQLPVVDPDQEYVIDEALGPMLTAYEH